MNAIHLNQKMPAGTTALQFIQLFSTLSFSVLYSSLVLYATKALHISDDLATDLMGTFVAFNFAIHLLGGYAGGRYLSYRSLFCTGMGLIIIGCLLIAIGKIHFLYWGLAFFLTGSGVNVTCINCMLTQLFDPEDKRRESAFLWNYSAMNVGFFIGFALAGYFQLQQAYQTMFGFSAIGNAIAMAVAVINWKKLADLNTHLTQCTHSYRYAIKAVGMIIILILGLRWLFSHAGLGTHVVVWVAVIMALTLAFLAKKQPSTSARKKMWAYIILAIASLVFWSIYQLIPMGLTLFISRNVMRYAGGYLIPPQWFENINSILVIIGGPILATVFTWLRQKGYNVNIPFQFSCALVLTGVAMFMLSIGIHYANPQGYVNAIWPSVCYILLSFGELFISPIGFAMIGQLAPTKLRGIMMGSWLMITGVGATFSSMASKSMLGHQKLIDPLLTNAHYNLMFFELGIIAVMMGLILFSISPILRRFIGHVEKANI